MPFTTQDDRAKFPDSASLEENLALAAASGQVGDRCFLFYRELMRKWREAPRWTTAHVMFQGLLAADFDCPEDEAAAWLAWQVFFCMEVMPYEIKKRQENGEVGGN